jgi:uncharacterized membrane protein YgcG
MGICRSVVHIAKVHLFNECTCTNPTLLVMNEFFLLKYLVRHNRGKYGLHNFPGGGTRDAALGEGKRKGKASGAGNEGEEMQQHVHMKDRGIVILDVGQPPSDFPESELTRPTSPLQGGRRRPKVALTPTLRAGLMALILYEARRYGSGEVDSSISIAAMAKFTYQRGDMASVCRFFGLEKPISYPDIWSAFVRLAEGSAAQERTEKGEAKWKSEFPPFTLEAVSKDKGGGKMGDNELYVAVKSDDGDDGDDGDGGDGGAGGGAGGGDGGGGGGGGGGMDEEEVKKVKEDTGDKKDMEVEAQGSGDA